MMKFRLCKPNETPESPDKAEISATPPEVRALRSKGSRTYEAKLTSRGIRFQHVEYYSNGVRANSESLTIRFNEWPTFWEDMEELVALYNEHMEKTNG